MQEKELWIGAIGILTLTIYLMLKGKMMIKPSIKPHSSDDDDDSEESITPDEDNI